MQTKHFVNDPTKIVLDALKSLPLVNPHVSLDLENKVVYADTQKPGQLSIVSGGGSGHEPSFVGFVGQGCLSASVAGTIFASPSSQQVLSAIENVDSSNGVLVTVMNYTGDILNFAVAIEKAKARNPNKQIEMLVVADDVGVPRSRAGKVGRRGIAGTVLVHKITGAMAAAGYSIDDTLKVGRVLCENLVSVGASLSRVHVPGRPVEESAETKLAADQIELGMGIHNETGSGRVSGESAELPALVREMLRQLLDTKDSDRNFLSSQQDDMVLLINNLGSVSVLEMGAIAAEVIEQLQQNHGKKLVRIYTGTMMTSLDGPGFSISLLNNVKLDVKDSVVALLDAPCNVPGWHAVSYTERSSTKSRTGKASTDSSSSGQNNLAYDSETAKKSLKAGLEAVIAAEPEVTNYDSIVGDGDCGTTLKRGAEGVLKLLSGSAPDNVVSLLEQSTAVVEDTMDGTSGALYSIFFNALTQSVKQQANSNVKVDAQFWANALQNALVALEKYTPARVGDRTMMDALIPFVDTLKSSGNVVQAAQAAEKGAESTKSLRPNLGRTVYVGNEENWLGKVPDPGAWGLSKLLSGLAM